MGQKTARISVFSHIILFFLLTSCTKTLPNKKSIAKHDGYTITGKTSKTDAKYVYLINEKNKKIDSSIIKKQSFSLQGKVNKPTLFYLQLKNYKQAIITENTNYNILLNNTKGLFIGGKLQEKLNKYKNKKDFYLNKKSNYYHQYFYKDIDLNTYLNKLDALQKLEKKAFTNFIIENKTNILSSYVLKQQKLSSNEVFELKKQTDLSNNTKLVSNLDTLYKHLKIDEAAKKILRRKQAPLFDGVNLSGSKSSLKELLKRKKLFVIDFWASWCPPCRASSPKLIELYNTYHHKGFDILTVSEDRSVSAWEDGIYIDGIEVWHHIYDDFNRISSMYGVTSLPHLVLIDENGKIIKNKISLKDLETLLHKKFN